MTEATLIPDLLRQRRTTEPNRVAIAVAGVASMTYADWDRRSNAIARGLLARRVATGDVIALFFENSEWLDFAAAYFGVLKAGAVAVPLSSRFTGPHLHSILDQCAATGIVHGRRRPDSPAWRATPADLESGQSPEPIQAPAAPEDVAEILYTSGTTGRPKGVACRHSHVVSPLTRPGDWPPSWWRDCAGGVYLHANAISTAGGQLRLFEPLGMTRMTTVALPMFEPDQFCHLTAEHRASAVQLVPSMASSILDSGAHRRHDVSSVRVVSLGCAPLPPALVPRLAAAFGDARLVNMYELSEARYAGTSMIHGADRHDSVGRPRGKSQIRVAAEAGGEAPAGAVGEVMLRWPGLPSQHYFRDAAATAKVFVNGWTRTGDAGYLDEEGALHLVDRLKDVIIKGGINISTIEVENALRDHRDVRDCSVFGFADSLRGEDVAAAVVLRRPIPPRELRDFLSRRLAAHQVPQRFLQLEELPRNRSGKVLKDELRARLFPGEPRVEPIADDVNAG